MTKKALVILVIVLLWAGTVVPTAPAQEGGECPALVEQAYATAAEACAETGRDEACYGHAAITAEARDPDAAWKFEQPGDRVDVAEIAGLRLDAMDTTAGVWGIALLRVQANLPDDAPENVEIVLFGDVEMAQTEDAGPEYGPMQAFTFRSGVDDAPCAEAPASGLLIQTPAGVGEITLLVNEVVIDLGSTAFLQAEPGAEMTVRVVEGQAAITAQDETVTVFAGAETAIPLDKAGIAAGAPSPAAAYDEAALQSLPLDLLSREVEIAPPLAEESPAGSLAEVGPGDPCTVAPSQTVNRRGGPGTNYPIQGQLAAGQTANPDGQAQGADEYTWWRLTDGTWVRSDVVSAAGNCDGLPVVEAPEPPPVDTQPQGAGGSGQPGKPEILWCYWGTGATTRPASGPQRVTFAACRGCWASLEEATNAYHAGGYSMWVVIDGGEVVPLTRYQWIGQDAGSDPTCPEMPTPHSFCLVSEPVTLSPGAHSLAYWSTDPRYGTGQTTCTYTAH